jgi:hypothetical protein
MAAKQPGHFFDKAGCFPVLVQHLNAIRVDAADGGMLDPRQWL